MVVSALIHCYDSNLKLNPLIYVSNWLKDKTKKQSKFLILLCLNADFSQQFKLMT